MLRHIPGKRLAGLAATTASARSCRNVLYATALLCLLTLMAGCGRQELTLDVFEEVTAGSGLESLTGMSYGATWGDFDGDGLADVYLTHHLNAAGLYRNAGAGRFEDVTAKYFAPEDILADKHGSAWADFDNDGRTDLVQLTGAVKGVGAEPKLLFSNRGDHFVNVADAVGVVNPDGRTRMPLWLDLNGDGKLDLLQGAEIRLDGKTPPFVFLQGDAHFQPFDTALDFKSRGAPFCVLTELTGDNRPELVCRLLGQDGALQVFDLADLPARSLDILPQTAFEDIAAADFDNDGRIDVFLTRKNAPGPLAFGRPSDSQIVASLRIDKHNLDKSMGFRFRSKGKLSVRLAAASPEGALTPAHVHLGANGTHPNSLNFDVPPEIGPLAQPVAGAQTAVHVGFTAPDQWEILVAAPREALAAGTWKQQEIQASLVSSEPIAQLEAIGETKPEEAPARLFMNRGGEMREESDKRGVNTRLLSGANVVAGDFDNDMDIDLFILASGDIGQQENQLLLNDGKGYFRVVKAAGGAAGSPSGVGDSVTTVDFDGDGFLDLFVANGGSMGRSLGLPSDGGNYQLFRNKGNGNHWLMIDLEGTRSNRDGIGAIVRVTAGKVTQTRVQDGGVHYRSQNHSRLHFGLAKHTQADTITIHWPSGQIQQLKAIPANQVLRVTEPTPQGEPRQAPRE